MTKRGRFLILLNLPLVLAGAGCERAAHGTARHARGAPAAALALAAAVQTAPVGQQAGPAEAVCDTVLARWQATRGATARLVDTTAVVASSSQPQRGCAVVATAPKGVDRVLWKTLYWAEHVPPGWTELGNYGADGPDGGSRTLQRNGVRCQIDFTQDGGDDGDPSYVPSPAIGETTICWEQR